LRDHRGDDEGARKFAQSTRFLFLDMVVALGRLIRRALRFSAGSQGHNTIWEVLSDGTQLLDSFPAGMKQ